MPPSSTWTSAPKWDIDEEKKQQLEASGDRFVKVVCDAPWLAVCFYSKGHPMRYWRDITLYDEVIQTIRHMKWLQRGEYEDEYV
jgi:hypothetical protein